MTRYDILIVGGGHAGAQTAIALRQQGFAGTLAIAGAESELPYERPPLSKEYFAGAKPFERILIRPAAFWAAREVTLLSGRRVGRIDPDAHTVTTDTDETIGYGTLVWAAGGAPRTLSCTGHHLAGVHTVRGRADVDRILAELDRVERVAVVGGGYVGLEAAAALVGKGKAVVLLEAAPRVLARVAGEPLSRFYEAEHRAHGVDVRLGVGVACIEERDGRACAVRLADGGTIEAGMVIVGVGIVPAVVPLIAAGAGGTDGVDVDAFCRTTLADVYAVGDCAAHLNPHAGGRRLRVESVQNANDQAVTAARSILGDPRPYAAVSWFWSNQYDLRLQTIGLSGGHDEAVLRGDTADRSFSVVYLKDGCVVALDCVNATRDYVQGRRLVEGGVRLPAATLARADVPLKDMGGD